MISVKFGFGVGVLAVCGMAMATQAEAACKKPVGQYVGSGTGAWYSRDDGSMTQLAVISLSINVNKDGSGTAFEIGKTYTTGNYSQTWSTSASNHFFNAATCQGRVTTSLGTQYTYTSSSSGNVLTFIYTTNDDRLVMYSLRLEKV